MSLSRTRLLQQFEQAYASLAPQQKLAIDTMEGPVRASASGNMGKDDLLAIRIGSLVLNTAVLPERILCFSHTVAQAEAIRQQLSLFTGPEALRVPIFTFAQFCQALIEENPTLFPEASRISLSLFERIDLFTRLIDAFPKGHPLKQYRGDVYKEMGRLRSLFSTLKQDGWTPDFISQQADTWLREPGRTEEEREQAEQLLAATAAFHHYQHLLREGNQYDDDDKIAWVITAFEKIPSFLQQYQQQFTALLADEDYLLNSGQRRLLNLLINHQEQPNLFVADNNQLQPIQQFYHTAHEEKIGITIQVQQLLQQGVPPSHIAVLYKEDAWGRQLQPYCHLLNIPVQRKLNLFREPLVQKILHLLDYLAAENNIAGSGDELLFELLHADWFGIPPAEITAMAIELSGRQYNGNNTSLRRLLYEKAHAPAKDLFTPPPHEGLKTASKAIEHLVNLIPQVRLSTLIDNIIRETGILAFILKSPDKVRLREIVTYLIDGIKAEAERNPFLHLQQLVKLLGLMQRQHIPFMLVQKPTEGIHLLTFSEAIGMEFPYVFLAGNDASAASATHQSISTSYFPPCFFSWLHKVPQENPNNTYQAAFTSAQKQMVLSYSRNEAELPAQTVVIAPEEVNRFQQLAIPEKQAPEIAKLDKALESRLLEKFMMSASALNHYLYCPLAFYYGNLVRIPSPRNEAAEFGSAVHYALEQLFRKMQADHEAFPSKAVFISDFEVYMQQHRGCFTPEQFMRRMDYGRDVLSDYYDEYIRRWNTIVAVERNIRNVIVHGVPLKGKIDKLEFDGRSVNIVDYKTGDPEKAKLSLTRPGPQWPQGGNYWRQAVFYKILVDNYQQKEWRVTSAELDLVEPDRKKRYHKEKLFITPEDVETVTQQITSTWWRIQDRDFYTGCGQPGCHWCNFVRINNLAVAWHPLKGREL